MGMAEVFVLLLSLLHYQHNTKSLVNCFDLGNAFNFSIHQISSNIEQVVFPPRTSCLAALAPFRKLPPLASHVSRLSAALSRRRHAALQ